MDQPPGFIAQENYENVCKFILIFFLNSYLLQANDLNRDEMDNSLFFSCGDVNGPSAVVTYQPREVSR
jgi:hypothetical protein